MKQIMEIKGLTEGREFFIDHSEEGMYRIMTFVLEPAVHFEDIQGIRDWCAYIQLWDLYLLRIKKEKIGAFGILIGYFTNSDPEKATLLTSLLASSQNYGLYQEALSTRYSRLFSANPKPFIDILMRRQDWKHVIEMLQVGDWQAFKTGLTKLGHSEFENSLRSYALELENRDRELNWNRVLELFDAYANLPSPENGERLLSALPAGHFDKEIGDRGDALDRMLQEENSEILYEEVIWGERSAIEIYIRLLNVADGVFVENIESTIGWLARDKPELLLEEFAKYRDFEPFKNHGYPVSFIGVRYSVHPKAAEYILNKRIQAISSVKNPKYEEVQASCLRELKQALADYRVKN